MISTLKKYNDKIPNGKIKDKVQSFILNHKKDYYEKVDYLISDILNGKKDENRFSIISEMLNELQPILEQAERTFLDKLRDLFKWI